MNEANKPNYCQNFFFAQFDRKHEINVSESMFEFCLHIWCFVSNKSSDSHIALIHGIIYYFFAYLQLDLYQEKINMHISPNSCQRIYLKIAILPYYTCLKPMKKKHPGIQNSGIDSITHRECSHALTKCITSSAPQPNCFEWNLVLHFWCKRWCSFFGGGGGRNVDSMPVLCMHIIILIFTAKTCQHLRHQRERMSNGFVSKGRKSRCKR